MYDFSCLDAIYFGVECLKGIKLEQRFLHAFGYAHVFWS
jgi:hypothetical protein